MGWKLVKLSLCRHGKSPNVKDMIWWSHLVGAFATKFKRGYVSLAVNVMKSWPACQEFEPSTFEEPSCIGVMHVKSAESSNVILLV
ncbi:hypothetical protein TNCV_2885621 [Trichonephila clavipes]|nr:hypothetical protein TNCV_2885621 [Trichonephila clavipes]